MTASARRRIPQLAAPALIVAAMAGMRLGRQGWSLPWWVGPAEAALLLVAGRTLGLSWAELGLARTTWRRGLLWGAGAVAVVGTVYVVGVLLPVTRTAFIDSRYDLSLPGALHKAMVAIPLGTVLPEEVAFRSVLWGVLARHLGPWWVLGITSAGFGLWHVVPVGHIGATNEAVAASGGSAGLVLAGTVGLTAVGGLVFGELRRRSDSVLAAAGAHWATNALGVLLGLAARGLVRPG
jgi:membrane protease YdiL (CAAX protease family)